MVDSDPMLSLNPDLDPSVAIGFPGSLVCLKYQLLPLPIWIWSVYSFCPGIICGAGHA